MGKGATTSSRKNETRFHVINAIKTTEKERNEVFKKFSSCVSRWNSSY